MLLLRRRFTLSSLVFFLGGCASAFAGQASGNAPRGGDSTVKVEIALGPGREAAVEYSPVSGKPPLASPGTLYIKNAVRLGTLELGTPSADTTLELRLDDHGGAWRLGVRNPQSGTEVGNVALAPSPVAATSATRAVALLAEAKDAARLVISWNGREVSSPIQFLAPPPSRGLDNGRPNEPVNREHFSDATIQGRSQMLSQNNLTALTFAGSRSVSVSYLRDGLSADGPDHARAASAAPGSVIELTQASVPWLKTETPLRFGSYVIVAGPHPRAHSRSYGLWLKRVSNGWRLIFNDQANVWGTMHDVAADVAEVELAHRAGQDAATPFAVSLVPDGPDRGQLVLRWGRDTWSVPFEIMSSGR